MSSGGNRDRTFQYGIIIIITEYIAHRYYGSVFTTNSAARDSCYGRKGREKRKIYWNLFMHGYYYKIWTRA